jgi:hypothetical protein
MLIKFFDVQEKDGSPPNVFVYYDSDFTYLGNQIADVLSMQAVTKSPDAMHHLIMYLVDIYAGNPLTFSEREALIASFWSMNDLPRAVELNINLENTVNG